jgi:hypothetical protein
VSIGDGLVHWASHGLGFQHGLAATSRGRRVLSCSRVAGRGVLLDSREGWPRRARRGAAVVSRVRSRSAREKREKKEREPKSETVLGSAPEEAGRKLEPETRGRWSR